MNKKTLFFINSFLEVVANFTSIFATNTINIFRINIKFGAWLNNVRY